MFKLLSGGTPRIPLVGVWSREGRRGWRRGPGGGGPVRAAVSADLGRRIAPAAGDPRDRGGRGRRGSPWGSRTGTESGGRPACPTSSGSPRGRWWAHGFALRPGGALYVNIH